MNFANLNRLWSYLVVDSLCREGVKNFFISPGMRNAPMIWAVANHPQATLLNDIDERAQGFRSLGSSKASGSPSALVCTSGSAVTNYFPSIVEASKSSIPMIVISSDRPEELVANDANQTIDQNYLFGSHVRSFFNPGCPQEQYSPKALVGSIRQLVQQSLKPHRGPVHLNLPFREPLDQTPSTIPTSFLNQSLEILKRIDPVSSQVSKTDIISNSLKSLIKSFKKPMIVVGDMSQYTNQDSIIELLKKSSCLKYLDVTSGFKFLFNTQDNLLPSLDHPEILESFLSNPPDGIIHLGGRVTSKNYYKVLTQIKKTLISVNQSHLRQDPSFEVDFFINHNPIHFLRDIYTELATGYQLNTSSIVDSKASLIEQGPLAYPFISKKVTESLNESSYLFIGNSSLIRTFDYYATNTGSKAIKTFSNRGTSGIEGHLSTSWGIAHSIQSPLVSILGDISFLHDLGALSHISNNVLPILYIIVNNSGGGIFKLLPVKDDTELISQLVTPHKHNLSSIISSFNLNVDKVYEKEHFVDCLKSWNEKPTLRFLEVIIDDENNHLLYKNLNTMNF